MTALAVGTAQRALDEAVAYGATNTQDGEPIFQLVQAMLAVSGDRCRRTVRA